MLKNKKAAGRIVIVFAFVLSLLGALSLRDGNNFEATELPQPPVTQTATAAVSLQVTATPANPGGGMVGTVTMNETGNNATDDHILVMVVGEKEIEAYWITQSLAELSVPVQIPADAIRLNCVQALSGEKSWACYKP